MPAPCISFVAGIRHVDGPHSTTLEIWKEKGEFCLRIVSQGYTMEADKSRFLRVPRSSAKRPWASAVNLVITLLAEVLIGLKREFPENPIFVDKAYF